MFEKGQAYVALSRATNLEALQVMNFDAKKVGPRRSRSLTSLPQPPLTSRLLFLLYSYQVMCHAKVRLLPFFPHPPFLSRSVVR